MSSRAIDITDTTLGALSLRNLRSVAVIAAEGSLTAAARRLEFSQATLSAHLAAAESALGAALFERHGRGVVPTEPGRAVLPHIAAMFATLDALRADARGTHAPTVTIGAIETAAFSRLVPFIRRMERRDPGVKLALRVETSSELRRLVEHGDLELAVTAALRGNSRAATFQPLFDQELVLLVPERHRLATARRADLLALGDEQLIVGEEACAYRRIVEELLRNANVDVALRARFGSVRTLPHAVASGLGIAILPRDVVDPKPPKTAIVPLRKPIHVTIGLLQRRDAGEAARRIGAELVAAFARKH